MIIDNFTGEYNFLSNFYQGPETIFGYPTNEHFYQAMKTTNKPLRQLFRNPQMTPGQAKKQGRKLVLRPDWEEIKGEVMLTGLRAKFAPDSVLANKLILTHPHALVEGNAWHDNVWGNCECENCVDSLGQNLLGFFLMKVRIELVHDTLNN